MPDATIAADPGRSMEPSVRTARDSGADEPVAAVRPRTARAGCSEGAQALAGNALETAMKWHGNAWIRQSFPQVTYPPKAGHHGTIGSALDDADD
ncbi:hypothetical protein [Streptomyces sp. NBC_00258]|uniref:hypothetical protein n=1 Tax=Streptomyces sp. NBC_00258 TaxID=2903642 RepID=UPI002E2B73D3|nr:hypothetical protein [Streptomyces sp. NBC_00258]